MKIIGKPLKQWTSNPCSSKFVKKTSMPYSVESFANIAAHCSYFFAFVQSLTERVVYVSQLVHSGVSGDKPRLQRWDNAIISAKIENMFVNNFFQNFT